MSLAEQEHTSQAFKKMKHGDVVMLEKAKSKEQEAQWSAEFAQHLRLIKRIRDAQAFIGRPLSEVQENRLDAKSDVQLEAMARRLEIQVTNAKSAWMKDTRRSILRIMELRQKQGQPVGPVERQALLALGKDEIAVRLKDEERRHREYLDAHGVPVASWRVNRGMVEEAVIESNGVMPDRTPNQAPAVKLSIEQMRDLAAS